MKYALLIVVAHKSVTEDLRNLGTLTRLALSEKGKVLQDRMLNAGTYLFPLDGGLHELAFVVGQARELGLPTHTLFFDQEPSFVITPRPDLQELAKAMAHPS